MSDLHIKVTIRPISEEGKRRGAGEVGEDYATADTAADTARRLSADAIKAVGAERAEVAVGVRRADSSAKGVGLRCTVVAADAPERAATLAASCVAQLLREPPPLPVAAAVAAATKAGTATNATLATVAAWAQPATAAAAPGLGGLLSLVPGLIQQGAELLKKNPEIQSALTQVLDQVAGALPPE